MLDKLGNRSKDVIWFIAESQDPNHTFGLVNKIETEVKSFYNKRKEAGEDATGRPMVGVGYSGGFVPLLEAIHRMNIPTASVVGAGAAIADIREVRETLEILGNALEYVQRNAFEPVSDLLQKFFGLIPVIGDFTASMIDVFFDKLSLIMVPGAMLTDAAWKALEQTVRLTLEATGVQAKMRDWQNIGPANVNSPDATLLNVYGDMDVLKTLNISGYRDRIGSFTGDKLINIEVVSLKDVATGKVMGLADHYIYFGKTRDYDEIEDPVLRASQREYDELVNDFMTKLILASSDSEKLQLFISQSVSDHKLQDMGNGKYKLFPTGY